MKEVLGSTLGLRHGLHIGGSGKYYLINLHRTLVYVLEIEDVFFRHDSAVFMPNPSEDASDGRSEHEVITGLAVLKTAFIRLKEFPEQKILIIGHTDTSGSEAYNFTLSELRAKSVLYMLEGKREPWVEIAEEKHKNDDIRQILKWVAQARGWDCDPDVNGSNTSTAIYNFQVAYNHDFHQSITEDGIIGPQTWGAIFDVYEAELARLLGTDVSGLGGYRSALRWFFGEQKAVGCGEAWPIEEAERNNYRSQLNRRVEILFFDPDENVTLDCHPPGEPCKKDLCPLYPPPRGSRVYLPVHPYARPLTIPTFFTIEQPGASNYVRMHSLIAYLVHFDDGTGNLERVQRFQIRAGKLGGYHKGNPVPIDCDRDAWFYFSHRDDLLTLDQNRFFKKDGSGLPLLGPIRVPCGENVRIELNIWDQKDWVIMRGPRVDGERPDNVKMAEWREDYTIGWHATLASGAPGFVPHGDCREKERQEQWKGRAPINLMHLGNPGGNPMWVGTLSALPTNKVKILLVHNVSSGGSLNVGSYNEIQPTGDNIDLPGYHTYNGSLVNRLVALSASDQSNSAIDALPNPPSRALVPGDMCWQNQGQTNNCGPYSFSTAMNYWFSYTNNPEEKNGALYARAGNVDDTINGARTPRDIVNAANRFNMHGRDNDAEELDKQRALKLLKLWIQAGVPVLILVKEEYTLSSYHWKTVVGYNGNRFFMNNSGADNEILIYRRTPGILYERAPIGNDVDSETAFYEKWRAAGGDIVDAFTSVDECTFIPLYPKDAMFRGTSAR